MSDTPATTINHPQHRRQRQLKALAAAVLLIAAGSTAYWALHGRHFVSTDNAYTAVESAQVTPAVGGTIRQVLVTDTQAVAEGDILVELDQTDARLNLAQAEADLNRAIRRVRGLVATDASLAAQVAAREADAQRAQAQLASAEAEFARAGTDLQRREPLVSTGAVSADELTRVRQTFASAEAALRAAQAVTQQARANLQAAISARDSNTVLIAGTTEDSHPDVMLAQARRDQARVDLERTIIRSPVTGIVAKRQVQLGQRVQPGTPLLSVVPTLNMHVDANFKEVQLEQVRTGQPVELHADLYGRAVTYHGRVAGFSGGSGAAFAAIPAQNATGNWIKVVQRLPVRISLDKEELTRYPLKVGLSMSASIDTRNP